jgi:ParB family chromosome partitioning protein
MTPEPEQIIEIDLNHLCAHPRNVRRSLGDLRDLTRSVRERGIETPLVVLPADGAGTHHIVAGHRRRAAAEAAGLSAAPCIVRQYDDEAEIVLAMLAENTQRSDGLNIVDEAQALAAVIDLRGGSVSARRLAAATGHSETWVRSRLALLTLPDSALDALHSGRITLDVAVALTGLVELPDLIDTLVRDHRSLTTWQVEKAARSARTAAAVAKVMARLEAKGIIAILEETWRDNQRAWKTLDDLSLDARPHAGEPCHAVVVKARYDGTPVEIPICTEPRRHRGKNPASEIVSPTPERRAEDEAARQERRELRGAADARRRWLTERLSRRSVPAPDALVLAVSTWTRTAPHSTVQHAAALLALDHDGDRVGSATAAVLDHLQSEPKRAAAVALALVAATAEEHAARSLRSPAAADYLDTIERLGYQPTDWEHAQRLTTAAA